MSDLSELHDCEKCRNKIVAITVDHVGVERCSYCGEVVDYKGWFKRKYPEMWNAVNKE